MWGLELAGVEPKDSGSRDSPCTLVREQDSKSNRRKKEERVSEGIRTPDPRNHNPML